MIEKELKALGRNDDLYQPAFDLLAKGLGFPLSEISNLPTPLSKILKEHMNEQWSTIVQGTWMLGICGDELFENTEPQEHEGIIFFLLKCPQEKWSNDFRTAINGMTQAFNRSFVAHHVILLFLHDSHRGPALSFSACNREAYKDSQRPGEKAGKVERLKNILLNQPMAEQISTLESLRVNGPFLIETRTFRNVVQRWMQAFVAGDVGILREAVRRFILDRKRIPEVDELREVFGRIATNTIQLEHGSYREFLISCLDGDGPNVDIFISKKVLSAFETFYRAFLLPPQEDTLCHMTLVENLLLLKSDELIQIKRDYESDFQHIWKKYGQKYPRQNRSLFGAKEPTEETIRYANELRDTVHLIRSQFDIEENSP